MIMGIVTVMAIMDILIKKNTRIRNKLNIVKDHLKRINRNQIAK